MARPPSGGPEALERARALVAAARTAEELRGAQAALFPLLGLSLLQTAELIGKDRYWVSRTRNRLLRGQTPQLRHGGRRRAGNGAEEEVVLVYLAIAQPGKDPGARVSVRKALREQLDVASVRPVAESTLSAMLNRVAPKIVPGLRGRQLERIQHVLPRLWFAYASLLQNLKTLGIKFEEPLTIPPPPAAWAKIIAA